MTSHQSLKDITNTMKTLGSSSRTCSTSPIKPNEFGWKGNHVIYDDDGNIFPVSSVEEQHAKNVAVAEEDSFGALSTSTESCYDSDTNEGSVDNWPFWTFRSPHKLRTPWCGTHVTFDDYNSGSCSSDDDEDKENIPILEDVMSKLSDLPQLLERSPQQ
jgi:hypothetical protein